MTRFMDILLGNRGVSHFHQAAIAERVRETFALSNGHPHMDVPVRYIHRTVPLASAPPHRGGSCSNISSSGSSNSGGNVSNNGDSFAMSETKEKRVKKLTSILPDSLDVIAESSERSECSNSSHHSAPEIREQIVIRSPKRKGSIPKSTRREGGSSNSSSSNSSSPKPSSPGKSRPTVKVPSSPGKSRSTVKAHRSRGSRDEDYDDDEGDSREYAPRRTARGSSDRAHHRNQHFSSDDSENDSTGATDKLTQSESERSGDMDDDNDVYVDDDEVENDDDEDSYISDDTSGKQKQSRLLDYLIKGTKKSEATQSEHQSFDEDNSVMKFDYDGEDNDDGDFSCSKQSLASSIRADGRDDDEELTWRSDPTQSLSDWTITIINVGSQTAEHYHVHKNMLAVGKRKSDYFADVFREQRKTAKRSNVTELRLPHTAASSIPMLLDYIYTGDKALVLSCETAPGMRYLSQYFGIRVLFERIMKFIQKDLSLKTLVAYFKGSTDLGDQKILGICARHTARNIHLIDVSHNLIECMDPLFFCKVTSSPSLESPEKKLHLSVLVAQYCQVHKETLDEIVFLELTKEESLPQIHYSAALCLLGMEADLVIATSVQSMLSMTSLQERCVKGLASNWRELTELDPNRTAQICRKLPSVVVTELMLKSLDSAKKDDARQTTTRVLVKRNTNSTKGKPTNEAGMKSEYDEAIAKVKAEFEQKTAHLQALCYEKDKHIKSYYEELARFQRVPVAPDGKLVASGRTAQPTVMPTLSKHAVEGYLLASKKKGSPKYPVFYYKGDEAEE